jgi:Ankyrin repeats (many copies)
VPDTCYLAAAAGDLDRLRGWFAPDGTLRPEAMRARPDFSDVGWPGRVVHDDADDVLAEGVALAAHLGRTAACEVLLDHGADPGRAPLYGLTPLHFAASMGLLDTAELLVRRGAPLDAVDGLHNGTPLAWALHEGHRDERLARLLGGG